MKLEVQRRKLIFYFAVGSQLKDIMENNDCEPMEVESNYRVVPMVNTQYILASCYVASIADDPLIPPQSRVNDLEFHIFPQPTINDAIRDTSSDAILASLETSMERLD